MNDSWEKRMEIFEQFYREKEEKEKRINDFTRYVIIERDKAWYSKDEEFLKEDEMQI